MNNQFCFAGQKWIEPDCEFVINSCLNDENSIIRNEAEIAVRR